MAELFPVAGCRLYMGGQITVPIRPMILSDFDTQTWVEIDGWSTMGAFGDSAQEITTSLINRDRDIKQKGTKNAGSMENTFAVMADDPGQQALLLAVESKRNYAFRILLNDRKQDTATISVAAPGVVTLADHGMVAGQPVRLFSTGTLPAPLQNEVEYFVATVLDEDTFTVSTTPGGAAIETTAAGTGTITAEYGGSWRYFAALVMGAQEQGGEANTIRNQSTTLSINSNIVRA